MHFILSFKITYLNI